MTSDDRLPTEIQQALEDDSVWQDPPGDLLARIEAQIEDESAASGASRWMWLVAAVFVVVAGTAAVINVFANDGGEPAAVIAIEGTDLAAEATGTADLFPTPNGWAIRFDVTGLPPAAEGTFYQGWVNNGTESVSVGTFHMRGDEPAPVELWAGVDLTEYSKLNITLQEIGAGPASSGVLIMTGTAEFEEQ